MNKPLFNKDRPLSWSAISSFEFDREQWYRKYVLNEEMRITPELKFGKEFADAIENGNPLAPVTLLSKVEQPFNVVFGKIKMIGYADTFDNVTFKAIGEFKTGAKAWDQKRVDEHGQITLYCLFNYITNKVKPEDTELFLEWIPTKKKSRDNGDMMGYDYDIEFAQPLKVHHFKTKRTMRDIVDLGSRINRVYAEMQQYAEDHV